MSSHSTRQLDALLLLRPELFIISLGRGHLPHVIGLFHRNPLFNIHTIVLPPLYQHIEISALMIGAKIQERV